MAVDQRARLSQPSFPIRRCNLLAAAFLMLAAASDQPHVVATFSMTISNPDGTVAEQIDKPDHVTPKEFADKLVAAEGLTSWSPVNPISSAPGATLAYKGRHAGNSREVTVYYSPAAKTVCRVRRQRGGLSDAHQAAVQWCAASLGITLPAKKSPVAGRN
jgi:hypothetical protein